MHFNHIANCKAVKIAGVYRDALEAAIFAPRIYDKPTARDRSSHCELADHSSGFDMRRRTVKSAVG
jgi:hypothetical protein